MRTQIWLTAVSFVLSYALASRDDTATSALFSNPTTCTTSIPTPSPTGLYCGVIGNLSSPAPIIPPSYIDYENASPENTCRDICILNPTCLSFRVQLFPALYTRHYTCQIYNTTVASQGYKPEKGTRMTFWERRCFALHCNTHTSAQPSKTACAPAETQALLDPSFEAAGDGPWALQNGASIVKNKTNAHSGRGYALTHSTGGSAAIIEQVATNLNQSAVYLARFVFKVAFEHVQPRQECELQSGGLTVTIYFGLGVTGYNTQIDTYSMNSPNLTVQFKLSCYIADAATVTANTTNTQVVVFVDDVTVTNLATNCPFVLQLRSADSSINGQYLSVRRTDTSEPDDNLSEVGRISNLTAAPRWGQTSFGSVYLQDPEIAPLNRFLTFAPGTFYHNIASVEYAAEDSAGDSAGNFGTGFESCGIVKDGTLRCNNAGKTHFVFCKNENMLYLDNPAKCPSEYSPCTPVELAVIFV